MRGLWLIDGSYVYKAGKSFQADNPTYEKRGIDYKKLKDCICKEFEIDNLDSWYFNSTPDPATDAQNAYHRWLKTTEPKGPNIRVKLYDLERKRKFVVGTVVQNFQSKCKKAWMWVLRLPRYACFNDMM